MRPAHVNNPNSNRRNNVNPNAGIWSGWFPQGEAQPASRGIQSTPQRQWDYAGNTTGLTAYGGEMPVVGQAVGQRLVNRVRGLAEQGLMVGATAELSNKLATGTWGIANRRNRIDQWSEARDTEPEEPTPPNPFDQPATEDVKGVRGPTQFEQLQMGLDKGDPRPTHPDSGKPATGVNQRRMDKVRQDWPKI